MFQEIPGACARYALHHLQKLREDARQKTLYLIRQGRMAPGASFPGLAEPASSAAGPSGITTVRNRPIAMMSAITLGSF